METMDRNVKTKQIMYTISNDNHVCDILGAWKPSPLKQGSRIRLISKSRLRISLLAYESIFPETIMWLSQFERGHVKTPPKLATTMEDYRVGHFLPWRWSARLYNISVNNSFFIGHFSKTDKNKLLVSVPTANNDQTVEGCVSKGWGERK